MKTVMPVVAASSGPQGWDYFERIYCISLMDRCDRRRQARIQFGKVGLAERVEFVIVDRHPCNAERGIYESHLACIRKGLACGAATILIFEDDVVFERFCPERLQAGIAYLAAQPQWALFFLGCLVRRSVKTTSPSVLAVSYRCLAHAYALNRHAAEELASKPWNGVVFDVMLRRFIDRAYAVYPSFAFQGDSPSDNDRHRRLDTFRRRCGGLRRIQMANEWCHRHGRLLVTLHLIGLASLGVLIFHFG